LTRKKQGAESEQCEGVGGEHDEGLLGDAEHRRNRVEREQEVDAADRDEHREQRRHHLASLPAREQLAAVVLGADGQEATRRLDDEVVLDVRVFVAVPEQLHGGVDQQDPEDQEHEGVGPTPPGVATSLPGFRRLTAPLLRSPEQGADTIIWLSATAPTPPTGLFWHDRRPRPEHYLPTTSHTERYRDRVWRFCADAIGVSLR